MNHFKNYSNPCNSHICSICHESIGRYYLVLHCQHYFHQHCYQNLIKHGFTHCPMCKSDISVNKVDSRIFRFNFKPILYQKPSHIVPVDRTLDHQYIYQTNIIVNPNKHTFILSDGCSRFINIVAHLSIIFMISCLVYISVLLFNRNFQISPIGFIIMCSIVGGIYLCCSGFCHCLLKI